MQSITRLVPVIPLLIVDYTVDYCFVYSTCNYQQKTMNRQIMSQSLLLSHPTSAEDSNNILQKMAWQMSPSPPSLSFAHYSTLIALIGCHSTDMRGLPTINSNRFVRPQVVPFFFGATSKTDGNIL